jgi:hypothetical protein
MSSGDLIKPYLINIFFNWSKVSRYDHFVDAREVLFRIGEALHWRFNTAQWPVNEHGFLRVPQQDLGALVYRLIIHYQHLSTLLVTVLITNSEIPNLPIPKILKIFASRHYIRKESISNTPIVSQNAISRLFHCSPSTAASRGDSNQVKNLPFSAFQKKVVFQSVSTNSKYPCTRNPSFKSFTISYNLCSRFRYGIGSRVVVKVTENRLMELK